MIWTRSTSFYVKLILNTLHFVIQKFSHMKLSYLLLEIKLFLIYWMMNILQYFLSLIKYQIHQPVINFQHSIRKICGSQLSIEKIPPHNKSHFMKFRNTRLNVENIMSRSIFSEGRANRGYILNIFGPNFIKSCLWFHMLKLVSQRNI